MEPQKKYIPVVLWNYVNRVLINDTGVLIGRKTRVR